MLYHALQRVARVNPDAVALSWVGGRASYAELNAQSDQLAYALSELGVQRGDRVVLWLEKGREVVVGSQAVLRLGAVYVPLDPAAPVRRAYAIVENCQSKLVITTKEQVGKLSMLGKSLPQVLCVDASAWQTISSLPTKGLNWCRAEKALACILYTSGTTGQPKGVSLSHRNMLAFVKWAQREVGVGTRDILANHAALNFDLSVFDLYASLEAGAEVSMIPHNVAFLPKALVAYVDTVRPTIWYSVPSALIMMMDRGGLLELPAPAIRTVIFAGEVFPIEWLRRLHEAWPTVRLLNFYGPTETNVCAWHEVTDADLAGVKSVPIGSACAGNSLWAITPAGRQALVGEVGELWVQGPTVMQGYWGESARVGASYATGDEVKVLADDRYEFVGRRDNRVKLRGHRVELGEVEAVLQSHPDVAVAAASVVGKGLDARLVASVVCARRRPSLLELKAYCSERLSRYMIVDRVHHVDALPLTRNGKVDRAALKLRLSTRTLPSQRRSIHE